MPLKEILQNQSAITNEIDGDVEIGVWQGLADLDPDVDAIYRLTSGKEIIFNNASPVVLDKHVYCPFNTQNTAWNLKAFPLMYLPATPSFRYTDILRGFIAQRLLWETNMYLGFTKATVFQERNAHDLMKDFVDEIECYTKTEAAVELLETLVPSGDLHADMNLAYVTLVEHGLVEMRELDLLRAWQNDFNRLYKASI